MCLHYKLFENTVGKGEIACNAIWFYPRDLMTYRNFLHDHIGPCVFFMPNEGLYSVMQCYMEIIVVCDLFTELDMILIFINSNF